MVVANIDESIMLSLCSVASEVLIFRKLDDPFRLAKVLEEFHPDIVILGKTAIESLRTSPHDLQSVMRGSNRACRAGRQLSSRLCETLRLLGRGLQNAEIGRQLGVATRTVKGYIQQLFIIFDVTNRTELLAFTLNSDLSTDETDEARWALCIKRLKSEGPFVLVSGDHQEANSVLHSTCGWPDSIHGFRN
jgi:DNA-binding CsgD family transcriptional regulator